MITLDLKKTAPWVSSEELKACEARVADAQQALEAGTCPGNDFLGWLHLPSSISADFIAEVKATADVLRAECDAVVVAGIGGSYLGAKAVIEALSNSFQWLQNDGSNPTILFAGNNIGEDYLYELTTLLKNKRFGVINISKSGTTTETALAFRLLKKQCEEQRGKEMAKKVIVAITDAKRGAARTCADKEGYKSFVIPDNVGGRFSVLTPVGLLPIAVAGFDIVQLVKGAQDMEQTAALPFAENPAAQYAAARYTEVKLEPVCRELFRDRQESTAAFLEYPGGCLCRGEQRIRVGNRGGSEVLPASGGDRGAGHEGREKGGDGKRGLDDKRGALFRQDARHGKQDASAGARQRRKGACQRALRRRRR